MDLRLEVVELPVTDVDRSLEFYTEQLGFNLDIDYQPDGLFRVVQLTPPGSPCSIHLESVDRVQQPHTYFLVVTDIEAAQRDLERRGAELAGIRHKAPVDTWIGGWEPGVDPGRRDYASMAEVSDPDGHLWVLQERGRSR
jgi:catechol 2,3-dioxygenase-like lactoylglutathione lyase family enzyme